MRHIDGGLAFQQDCRSCQVVEKGYANATFYPYLGPVVALVAGILILIQPALLSVIVAIYLIVTGILGLMGAKPTSRWW